MNRPKFDLALAGMIVDIKDFQGRPNTWIKGTGWHRLNIMKEQIIDLMEWANKEL